MNASGNFVANPVEERLIVLSPLATCTLAEYISIPLPPSELLAVMAQFVSALEYIHHEGIMHRDIKPQNVGVVVHSDNLRIIILDFGHAIKSPESSDHTKGTIPYLAPEVIALKKGSSSTPYNNSVDVWGMGLCMFALTSQSRVSWSRVSRKRYDGIAKKLDELKTRSNYLEQKCLGLIREMLAWDPAHRPSAAQLTVSMPAVSRRSRNVDGAMPPSKKVRE